MRKSLFATGSILALTATACVAHAETAAAPPAADSQTVQEIVITAQKRPEKLESVAVAASVVSPGALAHANASDISDLNNLVPSVQLNGSVNGRVPMGMRGISTDSNEQTVGIPSGVAIMVDGVPVPSDATAGNQLEDIDQIEVLKGPQGTLGGRTAAAGVINIVTRGPSSHLTGSLAVSATTDQELRASGFLAGPITDKIDFSLSAWHTKVVFPIKNVQLDKTTEQTSDGVRAKLRFDLTPDLDVTVGGRVSRADTQGGNFVYTYLTPGSTFLGAPPLTQALLFQNGVMPGPNNRQYSSPVSNAGSDVHDQDAFINISYALGDLTLSSNTAYLHESQTNIQDLFVVSAYFWNILTGGSAPPFYNYQTQTEAIDQISQEIKLVSPADKTLSYIAGLFYSKTVVNEFENRPFAPAQVYISVKPATATYALYGRATFKMTPTVSMIAGLRYNADDISYEYNQGVYVPQGTQSSAGRNRSSTVVGDVTLQKSLAEHSILYATYSRGYSPAAYNTSVALANNNPLTPVKEESVDNFEIGSKGQYFDRRLTVNAAAFYTKYTNYQIQTYEALPGYVNPPLALVNGGASTRGVEVDADWAATRTLRLSVNAAYIDAKFDDYKNAPCYGADANHAQPAVCHLDSATQQWVQDVSGKTMPNSPKLKFTLGADQRIPLPALPFDIDVNGSYAYRSSAQMLADQNPQAVQPAFGLLNLSATLTSHAGPYSLTFFVNNVLNHHYFVDVEDFWTSPWGGANTVVAQPARDTNRYAGLRLNAKF